MASTILAIVEMASSQSDRYLTVNNMLAELEGAVAGVHEDTPTANDIALTHDEFFYHQHFKCSGASAAYTLTTLGENDVATATQKTFSVWNADATYTLTVQSDDTGDTVDLAPGETAVLVQIGDDITKIAEQAGAAQTIPYDISFYHPGTVDTSEVLAHVEVARDITIPDDFDGSQCYVGTLPTDGDWVFDIADGGSNFGTLTITTGGTITFATTGGSQSMSAGDRLTITGPATADAAGADIAITIAATVD